MEAMDKKSIEHLALLARIELSDQEKESLAGEISEILEYVSAISDITAEEKPKEVSGLYNIMRDDEPNHEPGAYTEAILNAAPKREGRFMKVKKILNND